MVKSGESSVPGIVPAMEMVEQGQSQDKVSRKLIKIQHVREKEEEDRISALPDCLLLEILSRLPSTKGAIRTGTLSKRWKSIWTLLPILIFRLSDVTWDYVSFVDKTLTQCRQLKLKKLVLDAYSDTQFQSRLQNWIRYALTSNVEEFLLSLGSYDRSEFMLDRSFYTSSSFTSLTLGGCVLNPTGAIGWKNLRSLCISYAKLDEDLIENILSGSPVLETLVLKECLETLVLKECLGYKLLNITSTSVKKLVLFGYWKSVARDIIKINAPNILSLSIQDDLVLCKFLLLNVSSLVKVDLDYTPVNYRKRAPKEVQEEMLKRLILNLRHVKELKIGNFCSKVMSRLKAKGFDFPSNVKFPDEILV